ncbi:hypothetical protein [Lentzea fradiae]|nr:hypothetical protein [Lentzea fradiae]
MWILGTAEGESPSVADVVAAFEETARLLSARVAAMGRTAVFYVWYDAQALQLRCSTASVTRRTLPFGAKVDPDAPLAGIVENYLSGFWPETDEGFVLPVWSVDLGLLVTPVVGSATCRTR